MSDQPNPPPQTKKKIWATYILLTTASSILLALSITKTPKPPSTSKCHNSADPVFWDLLSQAVLHFFIGLCLAGLRCFAVTRYPVFYVVISAAFTAEFAGLVLYAVLCGSAGRLASLLLGWVAALFTAGAAAQVLVSDR